MTNTIPISEIIDHFLSEADVNENSCTTYRYWLRAFQKFMVNNALTLETISKADIIAYKKQLISTYSEKTVNCYITAVRMLFRWLSDVNYSKNITEGVRLIKIKNLYRKKPLTQDQVVALIQSCTNTRDKAIIRLMVVHGLRAMEVSSLETNDYHPNKGTLLIWGKGHNSKDVEIELSKDVCTDIVMQQIPYSQWLFTSVKGKQLTPQRISDMVRTQLKRAGIDDPAITGHSLRHTAAVTLMHKTNNNIIAVSHFLRHTDIKTTQIYIENMRKDNTNISTILNGIDEDLTQAIKQSQNSNQTNGNTAAVLLSI